MKKVILTLLVVGMVVSGFAQEAKEKKPKTISVTGSSEIEITPDIIYLSIVLEEYNKDKNTKINMATLEDQLKKAVQKAGIPEENLTVADVSGDQQWKRKKKDVDFLSSKAFILKVNNLVKVNTIVNGIDDGGLKDISISDYTSSRMDEYRLQVKVKALQAAKAKANAMMEGIGEKLGGVMEVNETPVNVIYPAVNTMMYAERAKANDASEDTNINFKTIKVSAEISAVFSIQ